MLRLHPKQARRWVQLAVLSLVVATICLSWRTVTVTVPMQRGYSDDDGDSDGGFLDSGYGYAILGRRPVRAHRPSVSGGVANGVGGGEHDGPQKALSPVQEQDQQELQQGQQGQQQVVPVPGLGIRPYLDKDDADKIPTSGKAPCAADLRHLQSAKLGLSDEIVYHRRCVKTVWSKDVDRNKVATVKEQLLLENPQELKLSNCAAAAVVAECEPLELVVPEPHPIEANDHIIFGVASSASRLLDSTVPFAHWLAGTNALLVGIVTDNDAESARWLEAYYTMHGIRASFKPVENRTHTVSETHFTMLRDMVNASTPLTRWFGILDDDTFAPSLLPLSRALDAYDATRPYYIGALSEDWNANKRFGNMAFGGAGAFLSRPLAEQLVPLIDQCLAEATITSGDGILRECITRNTRTRLTAMPGLWQQDIHDDASGFFEGDPRPLLTVHHWKSWYRDPIDHMAAVTRWCGDCFLQRWRFGADTVLSNGYSISVYAQGHRRIKLGRKEATWRHADSGFFDLSMGPLRLPVERGGKKQFKVVKGGMLGEDSEDGKKRFVQTYVHKATEEGGRDEVVDLVWT